MVIAANRFKNIIKEKKQTEKMLGPKGTNLVDAGMEERKEAWGEEMKEED